jgi:hypothetical protein
MAGIQESQGVGQMSANLNTGVVGAQITETLGNFIVSFSVGLQGMLESQFTGNFGVLTGVPVFPLPGEVLLGVVYGPNGSDYTGTLSSSGGGSGSYIRRR